MSGGHVEIGLVPFGSIGLTLFGLDLALASPHHLAGAARTAWRRCWPSRQCGGCCGDLLLLGVFGGFFIVPLYALVRVAQQRAAPGADHRRQQHPQCAVHGRRRARGSRRLLGAGLSIPALFGVAALLNAAVALYIYRLVPEFLLRFVAWLLVQAGVPAAHPRGSNTFPKEGPAVLVSTMCSFVDAVIITPPAGGRSAS